METYAFWRPPVRTLTFEDFTNMQKQQGECEADGEGQHNRAALCDSISLLKLCFILKGRTFHAGLTCV